MPFNASDYIKALTAAVEVGSPFLGEDGLVHMVYARFETLCERIVDSGGSVPVELNGTYTKDGSLITCLACLAVK